MANTKITSHVIESGAVESTHIASGAITASHVTGITTANITENTNLYYTDTRARASISVTGGNLAYDSATGVLQLTDSEIRDALSATSSGDGSLTYTAGTGVIAYTGPSASEVQAHLSAGTGVTYSGGQFSIGQAVGTSDTVSFGNITTAGYLRGPANFTIDPAAYGDDTGTLIIAGNLQVDGTTTTINSTTLTVDDLNLTLASGAADSAAANGAGITVDGASATLLYQASGDKFVFNKGLDVTGNIGVTGTVDGRDVATDGTKLDTIETSSTADQTGAEIKALYEAETNAYTDTLNTKLNAIEALADVTDTTNVTAAGALMDSELTDIASVKALNQGIATTDDPTFTNTKLAAIAASNSDTAVDVFVYDTRKDSDGGAWRKRTQNTSWYNETLNTSTRGARKEFPCVAVIVAEAAQVTIYDGDDPDMPMWMVFNATAFEVAIGGGSTSNISCLASLNGRVLVGAANYDIHCIDFVGDRVARNSGSIHAFNGTIGERNTTADWVAGGSWFMTGTIVNRTINDVAMTVLPNAPIDADTGLPVPTIAVATGGGVSVIKDDRTVVDITSANGWIKSGYLTFDQDNYIVAHVGNATGQGLVFRYQIPSSDITVSGGDSRMLGGANIYNQSFPHFGSDLGGLSKIAETESGFAVNAKNNATDILVKYWKNNNTDYSNSSVAYINSDYNTGWMNGDIKLATLSDTDTTNVTGTNLVTNGDFASNTTGWSSGNVSTLSVSGGQLVITATGAAYPSAKQDISVVPNQPYYYSVDLKRGTCNVNVHLEYNDNAGSGWQQLASHNSTTLTTFTGTIVPSSSTIDLRVTIFTNSATTGHTAIADNVVVKLAENDRSINGSGYQGKALGVFGTVTKTAVATGADLVAYTNFVDGTNYLFQPPNSDMDFGTGDFSVMLWHYHEDATLNDTIYFASGKSSNDGWQVGAAGSDQSYLWILGGDIKARTSSGSIIEQAWTHLTYVRRNGVTEIWVNGVLQTTAAGANDCDTNEGIEIPISTACGDGNDLLSLLRISATAPSPEQIKKIYEDEKVLFQENAKATLYGSSDSVTALAYDDDTELLHVGTSAGRSEFQGLRRINNTTDAVGAAISASNGFIVED